MTTESATATGSLTQPAAPPGGGEELPPGPFELERRRALQQRGRFSAPGPLAILTRRACVPFSLTSVANPKLGDACRRVIDRSEEPVSKADLSSVLARIQTRNAARVVGALVAMDRWGERLTWSEIAKAIQVLTDDPNVNKTAVSRGLDTAIADGLVVVLRKEGAVWGYQPGPVLARAIARENAR